MKRTYLPIETLSSWAHLNGISIYDVAFQKPGANGETGKGAGIVATQKRYHTESEIEESTNELLLKVPSDMVLSLETVENHAKSDRYLREVLEAVGDFGRTPRGAILIFLLVQLTHSSPDFAEERHKIGVSNPWAAYVKFMPPEIPLPTFWTMEELELLRGTSLRIALEEKIASLEKEFETLSRATECIPWCQERWWDEDTGKLTIEDWKYVDAMFRSRMVDLPGCGHSMVPCIDMANHAPEGTVNALYEQDVEGNATLQLRLGRDLHPGDEVTITYGDDKPASEMVFSYGFLDSDKTDAKQIFLDLDIPEDDPLKIAKKAFFKNAPGVRVMSTNFAAGNSGEMGTTWDSLIVWWACVNEEDGLEFRVLQTNDGGRELKVSWKKEDVKNSGQLKEILAADPLWDIFHLRAVVLILERLETQFFTLEATERMVRDIQQDNYMRAIFRPNIFSTVTKLRELEENLLSRAIKDLEKQRETLMATETVSTYLAQHQQSADVEEDFS